MELKVKGPNRDLHLGTYGGTLANPINILSDIISSLIDNKGKITIPGFYDDVIEIDKSRRDLIEEKSNFDEENFKKWINDHGNPFEYILRDDGTIAYEMGLIGVPETFFIVNKMTQKKIQGPLFYEDVEKYL